jgi:hypothetical protein
MNSGSRSNALGNERVFRSLSYVLVFLLMACAALTVSILIHNLFPDWHYGIIAGAALFVVIDRFFTYRQMKSLTFLSGEWLITVVAQWIVILLVLRLMLSFANGFAVLREDLSFFTRGYLDRLLTPEFVTALLLAALLWYITRLFLDLIDEIGLDQAAAWSEETPLIDREIVPAHQRLISLIFGLGIFLVILTTLTRMNLRTIIASSGPMPHVEFSRFSGAEAGVLFYFVFGLVLLSLSRLMSLQIHWNRQRIPISSQHLARQWGLYSLIFFLVLVIIVSLLPSGDSVGFFSVVGTVLGFLFMVLLFITQLVVGLVLLLFGLPFLLFGKPPPVLPHSVPSAVPVLPPQPLMPTPVNETWVLIRSFLLWGLLVIIVVFALIQFVKQHKTILPALRRTRVVNWLILAWQWLHTNADKTGERLSHLLAEGWQNMFSRLEEKRILPPLRLISLRSLDPRRRVFFFYHAMVRRGGELDVARKPSQTPSEYAATFEQAVPSAGEDVDSMTEAFIRARYSRQEIHAADSDTVKAAWERVRRQLQERRKTKKAKK